MASLSDRAKQAFSFFTSKGYSPTQSAALVGNLMQESYPDLRTGVEGDNGHAFGIAQWSGSRRNQFNDFAQINKLDPTDLNTQLGFVHEELSGGTGDAAQIRAGEKIRGYKGNDVAEASKLVSDTFFRPGKPMYDRRSQYAQQVLEAAGVDTSNMQPEEVVAAAQKVQSGETPALSEQQWSPALVEAALSRAAGGPVAGASPEEKKKPYVPEAMSTPALADPVLVGGQRPGIQQAAPVGMPQGAVGGVPGQVQVAPLGAIGTPEGQLPQNWPAMAAPGQIQGTLARMQAGPAQMPQPNGQMAEPNVANPQQAAVPAPALTSSPQEVASDPDDRSFWSKANTWLKDPNHGQALLAVGSGLLSGRNWAEGGAAAGQNLLQLQQQNKQLEASKSRANQNRFRQAGNVTLKEGNPLGVNTTFAVFDESTGEFFSASGQKITEYVDSAVNRSDAPGVQGKPSQTQIIALRDTLRQQESAINILDRAITSYGKDYDMGLKNLANEISIRWKTITGSGKFTPEELNQRRLQGTLMGIVGQVKDPMGQTGVLTNQDFANIITGLGGRADMMTNPEVAVELLSHYLEETKATYTANRTFHEGLRTTYPNMKIQPWTPYFTGSNAESKDTGEGKTGTESSKNLDSMSTEEKMQYYLGQNR